ncbi:MAG: hypothetical protein J0M26_11080 [Planctomycetes bacterium]|nr:hypothetical protein [Planctomycetota bacterium]
MFIKKKSSAVRKNLRLGVESLEDRRLLAGNITATFIGGNLVLRGDAADNAVLIAQTSANKISITGKSDSGSATTINGLAGPVVFTGALNSIDADLGGGNDQFLVGNSSSDVNKLNDEILTGRAASFSGLASARTVVRYGISVRGGNGVDSVAIIADVGGDVYVDLGANNDGIGIQGSVVKGSVVVDGGAGELSNFIIRGTSVSNQVVINGGAGVNRVIVGTSSASGLTINTRDSNDSVDVTSANIANSIVLNTSGGNDSILVSGTAIGGSLRVNAGFGDDSISIDNASIRLDAIILAGVGNDTVQLTSKKPSTGVVATQTVVGWTLLIDLGLGNDVAVIGSTATGDSAVKVTGFVTLIGSDGVDSLTAWNSQFGNGSTVDMGRGNDTVSLSSVTVARGLSIFLGAGDDELTLAATAAAFAELYGGLGSDGSKLTGNQLGRLLLREFERTL